MAKSSPVMVQEEDPADELVRLRSENAGLKKRVEELEKEVESSKAKKRGGFFTRKKKASTTDGDAAAAPAEATAATPEDETAPAADSSPEGEQPAAAAAPSGGEEQSPDKKRKSGGIKDKLGKAFGRFRQPKGYEETPTEQPEADAVATPFVIPERQQVEWTVAKSFEKEEAPAPEEGAEGEAAAEGAEPAKRDAVFKNWTVEQVREWLIDLQLESYTETCQLTGEQMLATTNAQFEKDHGIKNQMHRKKLRLTLNAIASGEDMPSVLFDWDIKAVAELLQYNGMPQYVIEAFVADSVDGRVLTFLTPDDLTAMKILTPFVQSAIKRATQLLRQNNYTKDYMKVYVEPEQEPEPEEPAAEAAAEEAEAAPAEAAAAESAEAAPAEAAAASEDKPADEGEKTEGDKAEAGAAAEGGEDKPQEEAAAPAEKTEAEVKAEEDARAAEEAKKKDEEERRKQEAAKERQRRHYLRCAEALREQKPLLTWSNCDVVVWARSVELVDLSPKILGTGLSGALMVLDTCFTGESLCSVLGIPAKSAQKADIIAKFNELVGEEVVGEKTEASKCDGYAVLIAGQKAKRKRSLSFSGAIRRRNRNANAAAPQQHSQFLLTFEDGSEVFVSAHNTDCSTPKPAPVPEPAKAEEPKEAAAEGAAAAEATPENGEATAEAKEDASPADDEKTPLVEGDESAKPAETEEAAAAPAAAAATEEEAPKEEAAKAEEAAPAEEKTEEKPTEEVEVDSEDQKLLDGGEAT
ncbi:liprin-beta-1-like isoform X2 [Sycon ciliatum]|uniref:liprin-beta-1-like isoform X2 n=1 Tax=Sycon ciliatum TaxID=27933 RepID=UPI0031F7152F|eukprot:scpid38729/ scgid0611/ Liprin-beta-1; Protein tyrosine phosphatase receptor type f polypeptide-interacting protein-binding protein 1